MICSFEMQIYPRKSPPGYNGYMVASYKVQEKLVDKYGKTLKRIKVVGHLLPTARSVRYNITGHWQTGKHGLEYQMEDYEEIVENSRDGIIAYLSSGLIKGIGPKLAERIYDRFGEDTLEVMETNMEELLAIPGISKKKLERIQVSYLINRGARHVVALLAPHGILPSRAVKAFNRFGVQTAELVRENPYILCDVEGITFEKADKVAMDMSVDRKAPIRIDAGIIQSLKNAENNGHLCQIKEDVFSECRRVLKTPSITENELDAQIESLTARRELVNFREHYYREQTERAERQVGSAILNLLQYGSVSIPRLEDEIDRMQLQTNIQLADKQRQAVITALSNIFSIITGGPGTGKTMIQLMVLRIFERLYPDRKIVCCAPTGQAARQMAESTGYPATTIHRALGLRPGEEESAKEIEILDADLVLVDEVSMLDIFVARHLLRTLPPGCRLIFVGDSNQLRSVGPGAVLRDLIDSELVPTVVLSQIYRQASDSPIPYNAKLISEGSHELKTGTDFQIIETDSMEQSVMVQKELYIQEVQRLGLDHVIMLSPLRKKTVTGVNSLNALLQQELNPPADSKPEISLGDRIYRTGDKVMQTKNTDDLNNGDLGYIKKILVRGGETTVYVDFGDGRQADYEVSELDALDLAYASTVHKSQGSEYHTVLLFLQDEHKNMLTRSLLYTAITRGIKRVIIAGDRSALDKAIDNLGSNRLTMLKERLLEGMDLTSNS